MAEEDQVCCCGTNRGWLLFVATIIMTACALGIPLAIYWIVNIDSLDWKTEDPDNTKGLRETTLIGLWVFMAICAVVFLINLMPVIAERKKLPKLHLAYRNWQLIFLAVQAVHLAFCFSKYEEEQSHKIVAIFGIAATLFTFGLVQRRMAELQAEIGMMSFFRYSY